MILRTVRTMLELAGHVVFGACDGEECRHVLSFARPDLVVMDIFMPKRHGLEAIEEIRRHNPKQRILAISGGGYQRGIADVLEWARGAGADATLGKPFRREQFLGTVACLLGGDFPCDEAA